MALLFTLDASVFVAACRHYESGYASSRALLNGLSKAAIPLIEPAILPVEVASALIRTGSNPELAKDFAESIFGLPHLTLVALDSRMALRAIEITTQHKLRGADTLYVTIAIQYGARLVTLDNEQFRRAPVAVDACKPEVALTLLNTR